jgi:hypothetical protein
LKGDVIYLLAGTNMKKYIILLLVCIIYPQEICALEINDEFISNRIRNYGIKIVLKGQGVQIKVSPTEDSTVIYTHKSNDGTQPRIKPDIFYLIDEINVEDRVVGSIFVKSEALQGWRKISYASHRGMIIGWIKEGDYELLRDIEEREKRLKLENDARKLNELRKKQKDVRNSFKGFIFRGILMGISLEDQMFPCDKVEGKDDACYKEGYPGGEYYNIKNLSELGFYADTSVYLLEDKVEKIVTGVSDDGADKMLSLLKKKYGKPKIFDKDIIQNRMGAKFGRFTAVWYTKNCELVLSNRAGKVDEGILIITTKKYDQHQNAQKKKGDKKALKNL